MKKICDNKYDRRKLLYHPGTVASLLNKGDAWPVTVNTGFTTYCNHSCIWCSAAYEALIDPKQKGKDELLIDPDIMIKNIKILSRNGTKGLVIAGQGEPLLHPDAKRMLEAISSENLKFMIFTNGERLNSRLYDSLFGSCLAVRFSVDAATEEMHSRLHAAENSSGRGKADFYRIIKNIGNLVEEKRKRGVSFPEIGCQMICSSLTEDDFEGFAKLFKDIGVDYVVYKPLQGNIVNLGKSLSSFDLHSSEVERSEQASNMVDLLRNIKSKYEDDQFSVFVKQDQIESAYVKRFNGGVDYSTCRAHPLTPMIEPDGKVYLCVDLGGDEEYVIGNIYDDTIDQIWCSPRRNDVINKIDLINRCPAGCYLDEANRILSDLNSPDQFLHAELI